MRASFTAHIVIAFLGAAAAVALLEGIVKVSGLSPKVFRLGISSADSVFERSENPLLAYTLKKNFRSTSANCDRYFPFTNRAGQRDLERTVEKKPGGRRIIMLGDSVVAGSGVCDFEKTLSRSLERSLEKDHVEVLNFGVPGYCTGSEVELLAVRGLAYRPDVVLLVYVWNDYVDANALVVDHRTRPALVEDLFSRSDLFRLFSLRLNLFGFRDEYAPEIRPVAVDNRQAGLKRLAELAKRDGFSVKIVSWPFFTDGGIESADAAYIIPDRFRIPIDELARPYGFQIVELAGRFRQNFERQKARARGRRITPRWTYTVGDGTHPNERGARIAAAALAETMRE